MEDHDYLCRPQPAGQCAPAATCTRGEAAEKHAHHHQQQSGENKTKASSSWNLDKVGEFFYESDHLSLRGNRDYHALLKTVALLEDQRIQAIRDLERLKDCQEEALADPIGFVEKLQRNEDLGIPRPLQIAQIPNIDWSKYALSSAQIPFKKQKMTRLATKEVMGNSSASEDSTAAIQPSVSTPLGAVVDKSGMVTVRGRVYTKSKPTTFNQLWTAEEQKKLEELLLQYPPEEVESRRWEKIAAALGNRTPTQVASRVQKYFIKLTKAGLPVPGRQPNPSAIRKVSRRNRYNWHNSTFLVSYIPPVFMSDFDDDNSNSMPYSAASSSTDGDTTGFGAITADAASDDEGIPEEVKETPEYQELRMLLKIREKKLSSQGLAQHVGFKCDRCGCQPIIGTRYHCNDCPKDVSTDFCSDCVDCMHESGPHTSDHALEAIHQAQNSTFLDRDYMNFMGGDYNYLDPNYMPAT